MCWLLISDPVDTTELPQFASWLFNEYSYHLVKLAMRGHLVVTYKQEFRMDGLNSNPGTMAIQATSLNKSLLKLLSIMGQALC